MTTLPRPPRPPALPLIANAVPSALATRDQWVLWDWTLRQGKDGPVWTKPPLRVVGSGNAKANDADGWGSFTAALNAMRARRLAGVGFALSPDDPFTFGDLDDCRDPKSGEIAAWAMPVIERFRASYIEVSPSGTGIKILIQARLPEGRNRWRLGDGPGEYVEWFSERKYTTLTGHRLEIAGREIVDCQAELDALARECAAREERPPVAPVRAVQTRDDDEALLERARAARNGDAFSRLFDGGDISAHGNDHSVADLALCSHLAFWAGPDAARIDRLFRRSRLYRDKWEREDYRERTIAEALKGQTRFAPSVSQLRVPNGAAPSANGHHLEPLEAPAPEPDTPKPVEDPWPVLDEAALEGLAGDIVFALAPHTEADDVATLVTFLVLFGAACNRGPHLYVGEGRHGTNLFAVLVGNTSKARKGTSLDGPKRLMAMADPTFVSERFIDGLSSGEGLIWQVRDDVLKTNKKTGEDFVETPGVPDKRLVCVEEEFAGLLGVAERQGNTISPVVRRAWDARGLLASTTKNSPARATNPHIAILGHVTGMELKRTLTDVAVANGLGNRFLWCLVKRSKILPHPGRLTDAESAVLGAEIEEALTFGRRSGTFEQDQSAWDLWSEIYEELSEGRPGLSGALMARSEAQVLRLSLIYAVLSRSSVIGAQHLKSALALWQYCEASIVRIFGQATGDPIADRILTALRANGSMGRTEISDLFGRNIKAPELSAGLETLVALGLARSSKEKGDGDRPKTVWYPVIPGRVTSLFS
jgi:hypothetical protein